MTVRVKDNSSGIKELRKRIKEIKNKKLKVGIISNKITTNKQKMLMIASVNEFGTRDGRVPERSYIRATFDKHEKYIAEHTQDQIENYIYGKVSYKMAFTLLGEDLVGKTRRYMTLLKVPPNAPSTIEQKGSSNPLIDTGTLRKSISFVID